MAAALVSFRTNVDNTGTIQSALTEIVANAFPEFTPRNDYDIFVISWPLPDDLATDNASLYHFVDESLIESCAGSKNPQEDLKAALDFVDKLFSMPEEELIGLKPQDGDKNVLVRSIPHTDYAIRIWPSSPSRRGFCLDFVSAGSGEAIDTPPGVELWMSPVPDFPMRKMATLEKSYSPLCPQTKINVGMEKYSLMEKQDIILKRPGEDNTTLRIPPHPSPLPVPLMTGQIIEFLYSDVQGAPEPSAAIV